MVSLPFSLPLYQQSGTGAGGSIGLQPKTKKAIGASILAFCIINLALDGITTDDEYGHVHRSLQSSTLSPWAEQQFAGVEERPNPEKETGLFWDIPKAGGTTFKQLYRCMGQTMAHSVDVDPKFGHDQDTELAVMVHDLIFTREPTWAGHHWNDEEDNKGRFIALFRNPVDRAYSMFYYLQTATWEKTYRPEWATMSPLEWANLPNSESHKHIGSNYMVHKLVGKDDGEQVTEADLIMAKELVRQRFIVGLHDEMNESIRRFNIVLGVDEHTERAEQCLKEFNALGEQHGLEAISPVEEQELLRMIKSLFFRRQEEHALTQRKLNAHPKFEEGSPEYEAISQMNNLDMILYEYIQNLFQAQQEIIDSYANDDKPEEELHSSINVVEQYGNQETAPQEEDESPTKGLSYPIPPAPKKRRNCQVRFKDPSMALCYLVPYGANFGDELGPAVAQRLLEYKFGCSADDSVDALNLKAQGVSREGRTCLFTLGSIFHSVHDGDHVWGTGINPRWQGDDKYPERDSITVHSVRGKHTAQLLQDHQLVKSARDVDIGDPGFLIPALYSEYYHLPTRSIGKEPAFRSPDICFVPHAHDLDYEQIKNPPAGLRILTVKQHWEPMLEKLRMCDFIVSTSLHGIIVGDALGIPTMWFQFKGGVTENTEGSFKYRDYFESIGREKEMKPETEFSMKHFQDTTSYMKPLSVEDRRTIGEKFMSSFPFHLFETVVENDVAPLETNVHDQNSNRTLVIVMGSLRGGELAWESMYKNLLDVNSADLALVIGAKNDETNPSSLYEKAKYLYEFPEYEDWGDAVDLIDGSAGWREELLKYTSPDYGLFGAVKGHPRGSGAVIFMARWFVMKAFQENNWGDKYDRFVLTRSDHFYECQHDLSILDPTKLWVPTGEDQSGITDRHLVVSSELFLRAIDIYPTLVRHPTKYVDSEWTQERWGRDQSRPNPEKLIKRRWMEENLWDSVRRFNRVMFTCAVPGDQTRWKQMSADAVSGGLHLKYPNEYKQSKEFCQESVGGQPLSS